MAGSGFEQNLGQMANAKISQSLPALREGCVGFQVLDKTEDDTKGVGVMAYKIKDRWLLIPAF